MTGAADARAQAALEQGARVFCELVLLVEQAVEAHEQDQPLLLEELERALEALAAELDSNEGLLMALSRGGLQEQELANHLVNTALLSLLLARRLGLERQQQLDLGVVALLHDLPKVGLGHRALNALERTDRVSDKERAKVERHWLSALCKMMHHGGLGQQSLERLVTAYESQLEFSREDLYEGDPDDDPSLTISSRLVRLCDRLDTLTWGRPGKSALTLHEALLMVIQEAGERFEPGLVRALVQALGLFPCGTLVRLNTGQVGVVLRQDLEGHPERPLVRVVADAGGQTEEGELLDLSAERKTVIIGPELAQDLQINPVACFRLGLDA